MLLSSKYLDRHLDPTSHAYPQFSAYQSLGVENSGHIDPTQPPHPESARDLLAGHSSDCNA